MDGEPRRRGRLDVARNRPLLMLMLGHFTVDMYVGVLPVLYPLLIDRFELNLATVGFVSLAYSGGSSVSQPAFGWLADRFGTRFIGLALGWTALLYATIGFAPSFTVLVILAALAGLGSGAYHPFGAVHAAAVIPAGQRNTAMSIYATGGTLGVACGPLVGALIFTLFGVRGTGLMLLPGLSIAIWMLASMRAAAVHGATTHQPQTTAKRPVARGLLAVVVGVMMMRTGIHFSLVAFIPLWYSSLGYGAGFYGPLVTTMILCGAMGTLVAGSLADRFGRRVLILISAVLSIPTILLFAQFTGPIAFLTAALMGLLASSTTPLLLLLAQQLMIGRAGVASGLILGLGFVTGAIGIPIMGAVADEVGIQTAIRGLVIVAAVAVVLAWFLPSEDRLRRLSAPNAGTPRTRLPAAPAAAHGARSES